MKDSLNTNPHPKLLLVVGVPDAFTAHHVSRSYGVDYLWVSSLVLSAMHGMRDAGMKNTEPYSPLISGITSASSCPVIVDSDIGGRDTAELRRNMMTLTSAGAHGVCLEDEPYPKTNAMVNGLRPELLSTEAMAEKVSVAKSIFQPKNGIVIARTHTLMVGEPVSVSQKRIDAYAEAGATAICIHYTEGDWDWYSKTIASLALPLPLFLILSRENSIPDPIVKNADLRFVVYPNQIYRRMMRSLENGLSFEDSLMISAKELLSRAR